ncbi:hypothetical protein AAFF_G00005320 [Aldrovandia affinis]|uniref:Uncharacterized protein n=1 Tax=Aldrovandia affinis TaxID=143900 RepID=A0AAD7TE10_9TELE|nr:hypothetical protein AAFF_G00005320 [Aldrovandia affinis]
MQTLLYATARPMVVRTPEPPDHALQVCIYESPWQPQEGQLQPRADHKDGSFPKMVMCSTEEEESHCPGTFL